MFKQKQACILKVKSAIFNPLRVKLKGELFTDTATLLMYATDASAYREVPLAVVKAGNSEDLKVLIDFARTEKIPLIPRTAGTSLAGQV